MTRSHTTSSSLAPCNRHKWSVVKTFVAKKHVGPGRYRIGWWEVLNCRVCEGSSGRWAKYAPGRSL